MSTAIFPETWNSVQIGVIAKVVMGQAPSGESYNTDESGVPLIAGASDLADTFPHPLRWTTSPTQMCQPGDLIFCVRATIGEMNWADKEYCLGRGVAALQPERTLIEPDYLYYWLLANKESFIKLASGSTFVQIRRQDIESFAIPLPPLPEQRRIAAILRQADGLRQLRREADEKVKSLRQAIFYEMFGDPITNPKGWKFERLANLTTLITSGPRHWSTYYSEQGAKFIQVQNLAKNELNLKDIVHVLPPDSSDVRRAKVNPHDILFSITGVVGLVAVAPMDIEDAYISQHVAILRLKGGIEPAFIAAFLESDTGGQAQIRKQQYGQTKPGFGLEDIRSIEVFVPPLTLQQLFAAKALEINIAQANQAIAGQNLDALFQSLLSQAFSGELTAAWREEHRGLESMQALPVLPQPVEEKTIATEESAVEQPTVMPRADLIKVLSQEQQSVLDAVNSNDGYCTVEMLQDTSGIPPYIIRQGLQLLIRLGLVQVVQLPDRPVRDIVYTPAYRALADVDRVRERDLAILNEEVEKRMML